MFAHDWTARKPCHEPDRSFSNLLTARIYKGGVKKKNTGILTFKTERGIIWKRLCTIAEQVSALTDVFCHSLPDQSAVVLD